MEDRRTEPWVGNLTDLVEFADEGTVSKTLIDGPDTKIVLFAMAKGQSLSEHTASVPASIHVLQGLSTVTLGEDAHEAPAGAYIYMPAAMRHAVEATEDLVFLLTLHRG